MGLRDTLERAALPSPADGPYYLHVNKGALNAAAHTRWLNMAAGHGWRVVSVTEQNGNTITLLEHTETLRQRVPV